MDGRQNPRDNRSGTEAKLHGNLKAGVRAVCLGSSGVSGVAVWGAAGDPGPEVPGIYEFVTKTSITEAEPKVP